MHEHLSPFSNTLIGPLSDDAGFTRPDIECFIFLIRCSLRSYALRGLGVSPYLDMEFLSSFYLCGLYSLFDFIYIRLIACFIPLFI